MSMSTGPLTRSRSGEKMSSVADPSDWIERAVRNHPDRLFLATPKGRRYNYAALCDESGRIASALQGLGVQVGDRVVVRVEKSAEAVLLYIACLRLGAAFVPVNIACSPNEVEYFLSDSKPRVAVVDPADLVLLEPSARSTGVEHLVTLGADGGCTLMELVRRSDVISQSESNVGPDSLAAIVYTSGTTGRSKGAMLSRANLASNAAVLAEAWRFTNRDVLLHTLPLFHVHGLFAAINTVLVSGSSLLLLAKFDAASALELLPQVTVFMGVPTHYTRLLQQSGLNREVTAGVRLFVSGSAPLPADTHKEFLERTGHTILERYGMTETLMITSNPYAGVRKPGSVGIPLPGIAIRVANGATGAVESAADVIGTLEVKGPNVFTGYWQDPEKTRGEFTADGWVKTGDLGRIDRD